MNELITPAWNAPAKVKAFSTTRSGGVSHYPWQSLNLGAHVGDRPIDVEKNRQRLLALGQLPTKPFWLNQTHSTLVVKAESGDAIPPEADASWSNQSGKICTVMTADCLPVLFCDRKGSKVAAAHAGWRGLCDGILENTLAALEVLPAEVMVWLGPAIGPRVFEVGDEVRQEFIKNQSEAVSAFQRTGTKYLANLHQLAELRLRRAGVTIITRDTSCTYSEPERFFSYRRDGQTGRMATVIWLD